LQPETWLHEVGIASIAHQHGAVNFLQFKYRLPVRRLKLVVVEIGGICFTFPFVFYDFAFNFLSYFNVVLFVIILSLAMDVKS
jgi:hypothetical protein